MPANNNLTPKEFPFEVMFNKKPKTEFFNSLKNINVSLRMAPAYCDIRRECIAFANATWADHPWTNKEIDDNISDFVQDKIMYDVFKKRILPTTMENINLMFEIQGITVQEVTHILRYRGATFSAECTGDRFMNEKNFCIPTAVENSDEFNKRYKQICLDAKQLYCDMVDSKEICAHDARSILPRSSETFYFMRMNLKDAMTFIYDRVDKQIQPQADNIIAYYMMLCLVSRYPILSLIFNSDFIHRKADFYVATARNYRASNFYCPDEDSDCFEYNEKDFVYGTKKRDELLGTNRITPDVFTGIMKDTCHMLDKTRELIKLRYPKGVLDRPLTKEDLGGLA